VAAWSTVTHHPLFTLDILLLTMRPKTSRKTTAPKKRHAPIQPNFVRVDGRYRVGKILGSGGSGERDSCSSSTSLTSYLASVFLGKDIKTGTEVALKIGHADHMPSRLGHEYNVYKTITGCTGISPVRWFGKEGLHEVIVLDYLGTSLGDLISGQQSEHREVFSYAPQMVCALYA
jgi:serine/threonine protein kinase